MFEGLKKRMYERIEKNCVKVPNLSDGKTIYVKKSFGGWHVIYPPVNLKSVEDATDSKGNTDWSRVKFDKIALIFGTPFGAILTTIAVVVLLVIAFQFRGVVMDYNDLVNNSCVQNCLKAGLIN